MGKSSIEAITEERRRTEVNKNMVTEIILEIADQRWRLRFRYEP